MKKVAIIYDFFAHYRAPVMRELLASSQHDYILVGDVKPINSTLKAWCPDRAERFIYAPFRSFGRTVYFQTGALNVAFRSDIDAIIYMAYPNFLSTWISALIARLTRKRVLFWTHGWIRKESGPKAWLRRLLYKLPDAFLLYGHFSKVAGISRGFAPEDLHVIYNSLDYEVQRRHREKISADTLIDTRRRLFQNPQWPMVMCSARLRHECQFDLLIKAQAELERQGHRLNLLLVGDGPERERLEKLASLFGVSARFLGACYEEEMLAQMTSAANVTVSPGKVGLTAIQSLAYGTPVITHDDPEAQMPEFEAIIPGKTGDFFRRGNVADLARVVRAWTQTSLPDPVRRPLCYQVIDRFYNPGFQRRAIDRAVSGHPADDLFWLREPIAVSGSDCDQAAPAELRVEQTFA